MELPSQLLLVMMTDPKDNHNQSKVEQTISRPAAAKWGIKLLKILKLEKLIKLRSL